VYGNGIKTRIN